MGAAFCGHRWLAGACLSFGREVQAKRHLSAALECSRPIIHHVVKELCGSGESASVPRATEEVCEALLPAHVWCLQRLLELATKAGREQHIASIEQELRALDEQVRAVRRTKPHDIDPARDGNHAAGSLRVRSRAELLSMQKPSYDRPPTLPVWRIVESDKALRPSHKSRQSARKSGDDTSRKRRRKAKGKRSQQ